MHIRDTIVNLEQKHSCSIGVYAYDFSQQDTIFAYNEIDQKVAASSIKLFVAGAVLDALKTQNRVLTETLPMDESHFVKGASILADMDIKEVSIRNLLYLLLAHSDTTAQNVLMQLIDESVVHEYIERIGFEKTIFVSNQKSTKEHLSRTTPKDSVMFMHALWEKTILTPDDCSLLLSFLAQARMTYFGLRHLPVSFNTSAPKITERYSKAGKAHDSVNDTLVLKTNSGTLGVSVFIDTLPVTEYYNSVDHVGIKHIATITKGLFDMWQSNTYL